MVSMLLQLSVFKKIYKYNATHNNRIFTKLNTVVTQLNVNENMGPLLQLLRPDRWKILQLLKINGQNEKEFSQLRISEHEFNEFIEKHNWISQKGIVMVPESNELETNSYLMINHDGRLFQNNNGKYHTSSPIQKIGLKRAITQVGFSYSKYILNVVGVMKLLSETKAFFIIIINNMLYNIHIVKMYLYIFIILYYIIIHLLQLLIFMYQIGGKNVTTKKIK